MTKRLIGKTAIITGATSGIGRGIALKMAEEGAFVCVVGRDRERALAVVDEITKAGGEGSGYLCDITNPEEVKRMVDDVGRNKSRIDILVNAAGISPRGTVTGTSFEEFEAVMSVDLYSIFHFAKEVLPYMEEAGSGTIINIVGTYGMRPVPNKAGYACAKAAALSLTRSIAIDYARKGIRCNAVSPGYVDTPLNEGFEGERRDAFLEKYQPMEGMIDAGDIADAAVFLATDDSRFIMGQNLVVDGGTEACLYYLH